MNSHSGPKGILTQEGNFGPKGVRYTALVIGVYSMASTGMVFLTKRVLASHNVPLFLTWIHVTYTGLMATIAWSFLKSRVKQLPRVEYKRFDYHVIASSIKFAAMLGMNALCLQRVHISFYGISRSLAVVFNAVFGYMFMKKRTSLPVYLALLVVIVGFILGAQSLQTQGSVGCVVYGVLASVGVSWYGIATTYALQQLPKDHAIWLSSQHGGWAQIIFIPFVLYFESDAVIHVLADRLVLSWIGYSSLLAAVTNLLTVELLSVTSSFTYNVVETLNSSMQTTLSIMLESSTVTTQFIIANMCIIAGGYGCAIGSTLTPAVETNPVEGQVNPKEAIASKVTSQTSAQPVNQKSD